MTFITHLYFYNTHILRTYPWMMSWVQVGEWRPTLPSTQFVSARGWIPLCRWHQGAACESSPPSAQTARLQYAHKIQYNTLLHFLLCVKDWINKFKKFHKENSPISHVLIVRPIILVIETMQFIVIFFILNSSNYYPSKKKKKRKEKCWEHRHRIYYISSEKWLYVE